MAASRFSRREILEKCVAMGVLSAALPLRSSALAALYEEREQRHPTPDNALGPFYKRKAPERTNLRIAGDPGMPLAISETTPILSRERRRGPGRGRSTPPGLVSEAISGTSCPNGRPETDPPKPAGS